MKGRFADTSFWYARYVATDRRHEQARLIRPGPLVWTTEWVLGETWTLVNRRIGRSAALSCIRAIRNLPGVKLEPVTESDLDAAWVWLVQRGEREYSFVDSVSFRVMRRLRLAEALAFDGDLPPQGLSRYGNPPGRPLCFKIVAGRLRGAVTFTNRL